MLSRVYETAFLGFLFSAKNLKITYHSSIRLGEVYGKETPLNHILLSIQGEILHVLLIHLVRTRRQCFYLKSEGLKV